MSEQSGGAGWWIASDGKWYPPAQASGAPAPAAPVATVPPGPPSTGQPTSNRGKLIALLAVVGVLVVIAVGVAVTRDSGSSDGGLKAFCAQAEDVQSEAENVSSD